jgi:hypothetical protein
MRAPESVYATAFPFHALVLKSIFEAAKLALRGGHVDCYDRWGILGRVSNKSME